MRAEGREIISLGLGEPDFQTPEYVIKATETALENGFTHYSPSQGLPELREKIAGDYRQRYHKDFNASQVIVLPGIKSAVYTALAAILEPFDKVVNISPYYVSYPAMIKLAEPTAEIVNVKLQSDFSLDLQYLLEQLTEDKKCILLNSPNNPTGMMLTKDEVRAIVDACVKNHIYIIADEVYEKLVYSGYRHTSFAEYEQAKELLILTNGYSKSHAMTGFRLGYAVAPNAVVVKMNRIQQHVNTNTCTFIQKGACSIYENEPVHIKEYVAKLEQRVDFWDKQMNGLSYIRGRKPQAGFFYFADISETKMDSNSFCVKLLESTGIASTPGIAFGADWDHYVRFSIAVEMDVLERAASLMRELEKDF